MISLLTGLAIGLVFGVPEAPVGAGPATDDDSVHGGDGRHPV